MRCPFCETLNTRVIDSRVVGDGSQIRRRRECMHCQERFTSYEVADLHYPRIIKSDGRRESFDENKLRAGVLRAIEKRPVKIQKIDQLICRIKLHLRGLAEREVGASVLGNQVMQALRNVDEVAYIRFASVYRNFSDMRAFLDEIEKLEQPSAADDRQSVLFSTRQYEDEV